MKIYLVLAAVALLILLLLVVHSSRSLIMSPALVFVGVFLLGLFICIVNPDWDWDISGSTALLIVAVNYIFSFWQLLLTKVNFSLGINSQNSRTYYSYQIKNNVYSFAVFIEIVTLFSLLIFIFSIGGGLSLRAFVNARWWMIDNPLPNTIGHLQLFSKIIGLGYVYAICIDIVRGGRLNKKYFLPIIIYLLIEVSSTSRSGVIYFLGASMVIFITSIQLKMQSVYHHASLRKIMKIVLRFGIAVVALFLLLGKLTGKTALIGVWNSVATYFGGSIYALDYFVKNIHDFSSPFFGYNSFPIIKSVMEHLGRNVPKQMKYYFPFITIPSNTHDNLQRVTNLYTCINVPICDFGIIGGLLFFAILGWIYAIIYKRVKNDILNEMLLTPKIIVLGYMTMPVVCAEAAYSFDSFLFSPMALYSFIYIYIFIKLFLEKTVATTNG